MADHTVKYLFILRHPQCTVTVFDNVMSSSRIETCDDLSFFISSYRKLCLVSVMEQLVHSNDRLHRNIGKASDSLQMSFYFICLKFQLLII